MKKKGMARNKTFCKAGITLSFAAILFISPGFHLIHVNFHTHETCQAQHSSDKKEHLQIVKIEEHGRCPICRFMAATKLSHKPGMALSAQLPLLSVKIESRVFLLSQITLYHLFLPRAPPYLS